MVDQPKKEPYYKYVYFDLPFLIFVKDGFKDKTLEEWAKAYSERKEDLPYSPYAPKSNEPGYFAIGGGFPVYLPPDKVASAYVINLGNNIAVGLQFLRRINQNSTTKLCGEIIGDRTGRATFSSVRVNFDLKIINPQYHYDMQLFVNLGITAVNKFIEHYRVVANRFYVRPVTPQVIQTFLVITEFTDGTSNTQTYGSGSGPLHGLGGAIPDDIDKKLRDILITEELPPILNILELEIRDKLDLREWRLSVIESAVFFETWLHQYVRSLFKANGLSDHEIDNKFHRNDAHRIPLSAFAIAKNLISEASGFDFSITTEFDEWCTKTKDLRNLIVHGKQYVVSEKEARKCFEAVQNAISVIKQNA